MRESHSSIERFEVIFKILVFCKKQWRTSRQIQELFDIEFRVLQRYINNLVKNNYLERKSKYLATTQKAIEFINGGINE